jgi:type I restriction enzyme R subunit
MTFLPYFVEIFGGAGKLLRFFSFSFDKEVFLVFVGAARPPQTPKKQIPIKPSRFESATAGDSKLSNLAKAEFQMSRPDTFHYRMIFDGEQLSDLLALQGLGWKARTQKELALMEDLIPLLHKLAQGREISGLGAYEQ